MISALNSGGVFSSVAFTGASGQRKGVFELAAEINRLNEERQALTRIYELQAHELARPQFDAGEYAIVCGGEDWPGGIVGLVAGKLAQAYNRPTLVYRQFDGMVTGSGVIFRGRVGTGLTPSPAR